jgi:hypothetical protein
LLVSRRCASPIFPGRSRGAYDLGDAWREGDLLAWAHRRRYVGRADATELTEPTNEVISRLNERALVFSHGNAATVVDEQTSAIFKDPDDPDRKRFAKRLRTVVVDAEALRPLVEQVARWVKARANGDVVGALATDKLLGQVMRQHSKLPPWQGWRTTP